MCAIQFDLIFCSSNDFKEMKLNFSETWWKKIKYFPLYFITNDMLINHYQIANDSHLDIIIKNNYLQMGFTVAKFYSRFHFSWYHLAFFLHLKFYGKWNCFLFFFISSYNDKWNERFNSIKPFIYKYKNGRHLLCTCVS